VQIIDIQTKEVVVLPHENGILFPCCRHHDFFYSKFNVQFCCVAQALSVLHMQGKTQV
jgi:hypothetical protein